MPNYFTDEEAMRIARNVLMDEKNILKPNYMIYKQMMNLAVSTAIQHPIGYANSNDLIDDGTSFYLLELWKTKDADEGNNIPLYTVKEIS